MKKTAMILFSICLVLSFCSCKKVETPTEEVLNVEVDEEVATPFDITKDELLAMDAAQVKEMVETYLPNYRTQYKIAEDKVMTDEDWLSLRDAICLNLYKSLRPDKTEESEPVTDIYSGLDTSDPNWIYIAPTAEYIEGLSTAEFAEYMNGLYAYEVSSGDCEEEASEIDFRTLEEEILKELQETCILELKEIEAS